MTSAREANGGEVDGACGHSFYLGAPVIIIRFVRSLKVNRLAKNVDMLKN